DFAAARFNTDLSLDSGFGASGLVQVNFDGSDSDVATSLAIQSDGKIVLAGYSLFGQNDFAVARLTTDGVLDSSVTTDFGSSADVASAVMVDGTGLLVAGYSDVNGSNDFALVRYNSDGSIDTTFGTAGTGLVTTDFSSSSSDIAKGAVLQS